MADAIALRILERLLEEACDEGLFAAIFQEKQYRALFGKAEEILPNKNGEILGSALIIDRRGVDIYGQERSTDIRYFSCTNCDRQISGNRFAAHVAKCVTRGRRQRTTYT